MTSVRSLIRKVLKESVHRCQDGRLVDIDSTDCYEDVCNRIDDAQYVRDHQSRGSATRTYYNGILQDLRKNKRRLQKMHAV
jgi:hypothetical protein